MKKKLLLISILLVFAGCTIWYFSDNKLFNYLSLEKPLINANLLILEGWLYNDEIKEATRLFQTGSYKYIITTGVNTSSFFMMGGNGDLVVDVKQLNIDKGTHQLSIEAYSTLANKESGLFEILVDNEKIGGSFTTTKPVNYSFNFEADSTTDSITVSFLNDALYKKQDINLFISSVTIDNTRISVNDTLNYYRNIATPEWKNFLARNNSMRLKHVLMQYGIAADKIIPVGTYTYFESRTAQTAKNTLHALDSIFDSDTLKINIFSRKPHSRRTYLAYKKHINNNLQAGIITSTCGVSQAEKGRLKNLKELIGIIYIKISPW